MKFSRKKFLITGGAGFIGSVVAKKLQDENSEVVVLDDFSIGRKENIPLGCKIVQGNVADARLLYGIYDIDFILHFGAPSSVVLFNKTPDKCMMDTIIGIRNIFDYAMRSGVKKVVFASSSSVYGDTPLPQSEMTSTTPANLYGIAKFTCECVARLYSDIVPNVGLRIFAGYGPGEGHKGEIASVVTLFLNNIARNSGPIIFGNGTQSRDFVYIKDIVEATIRSIENSFVGIVNVGSGEHHTFNDLVDLINAFLGKDVRPCYVDKPLRYFEHTLADIDKMKKVLGISPMSLEDGLEKYVNAKGGLLSTVSSSIHAIRRA